MKFDTLIVLDCGEWGRIPEVLQPLAEKIPFKINLDHHQTNPRFGDINHVEARASSTGELVWNLIKRAKWPLDRISAEALWVAIVTDSGRFAYDTTAPSTFTCAADLLRHGVRTALINDYLYCAFGNIAMELKRRAYQSLEYTADCKIASVQLTAADFTELGGNKADAEDAIEIPRMLRGNKLAFFFYGDSNDLSITRVSIRTRAPYDASMIARKFGGGGHEKAAGCTINASIAEAKALVMAEANKLLKPTKGTGK